MRRGAPVPEGGKNGKGRNVTQTNSRECLEHAELYLKRAAEVTDPVLKKSLIVAAERWKRLAAEFESGSEWLALQRTS